jgi:DNA replication protein DnaC
MTAITLRPGPEAVERAGECLHCHAPLRQYRLAAGIREIWLPIVCARCGADDGIPAAERSLVALEIPPDPEQLARDRRLRLLNIPHGFQSATLETWHDHGRQLMRRKHALALRYIEVFRELPVAARLIVLQGAASTGKTHLAVALARFLALEHNVGARYVTFPDAVRELRAGADPRLEPADREIAILERYRGVDLLILDDVTGHAVRELGAVQGHLTDIVAARYDAGRPSVLITRDALGGPLEELLGEQLAAAVAANKALWWFGAQPYSRGTTHDADRGEALQGRDEHKDGAPLRP